MQNQPANLNAPGTKYVPVTKSDTDNLPDGLCRGLLLDADGTANLVDQDGTERSLVPLQKGYNWLFVLKVKTGGTATDIWAIY